MNKFFLLFLLFFFFIGCKKKTCVLFSDVVTYQINIETKQDISIFDLFSEIAVIPLETSSESIIGWGLPKIYKDKIYVLEDRQNIIMCFDLQGKWLFTINNFGRGNSEYQSLQALSIDHLNEHLLLLEFFGSIHEYTLEGKFIHKYTCKNLPPIHYLEAINKDTLLLYNMLDSPKIHFYSRKENKIIKSIWEENPLVNSTPGFYFYDDSLYFWASGYGNITYNLNGVELQPIFQWDFGERNYNINNLDVPKVSEKQWQGKMEVEWRQKNCPYEIANQMENRQYVYLLLNLNFTADFNKGIQALQRHVFYNKENHKYYIFDDFNEKINFGKVIYMDDNYLYSKINSYSNEMILQSNVLSPGEEEKLSNMKEDDNYAILKFKFK